MKIAGITLTLALLVGGGVYAAWQGSGGGKTAAIGEETTPNVPASQQAPDQPAPITFLGEDYVLPWPGQLELQSFVQAQNDEFRLWEALTTSCMQGRGFGYEPAPALVLAPGEQSEDQMQDPNLDTYNSLDEAGKASYSSALAGVDDVYSESPNPMPWPDGQGCIQMSREIYKGYNATAPDLIDAATKAYVGDQNNCVAEQQKAVDEADHRGEPTPETVPCENTSSSSLDGFSSENSDQIAALEASLRADFEQAREYLG